MRACPFGPTTEIARRLYYGTKTILRRGLASPGGRRSDCRPNASSSRHRSAAATANESGSVIRDAAATGVRALVSVGELHVGEDGVRVTLHHVRDAAGLRQRLPVKGAARSIAERLQRRD